MEEDYLYRIENLLLRQKKKRPWLSNETEIPIGTINGWFSRGRMPGADQMVRVARALGTTVEYLLTGEPSDDEVKVQKYGATAEAEELLRIFNQLPRNIQTLLMRTARSFLDSVSEENKERRA